MGQSDTVSILLSQINLWTKWVGRGSEVNQVHPPNSSAGTHSRGVDAVDLR